jgi:hypothetical protein
MQAVAVAEHLAEHAAKAEQVVGALAATALAMAAQGQQIRAVVQAVGAMVLATAHLVVQAL